MAGELERIGFTRDYSAEKLFKLSKCGDHKIELAAVRLRCAVAGDIKDEKSGATTINNTGPVMMIVGASAERMKALRGAIPQMSPERAEEERAARANERLAELKAGRAIPLKHSTNEFARQAVDEAIECQPCTVTDMVLELPEGPTVVRENASAGACEQAPLDV